MQNKTSNIAKHIRKCIFFRWTIILFCLSQLAACSFVGHSQGGADGAPRGDFDASKIPDAVPKKEHINPHTNKPYTVFGHRYIVLKNAKGYDKYGMASWYGTKFHGRYTSTNERYSVYGMTAASPVLPIPSYVQVTNLANNKKVIVRVNDRGPFAANRIMDLSYAAAKKLGYAGQGTARVRVTAIDPDVWNRQHNITFYANQQDKIPINSTNNLNPNQQPKLLASNEIKKTIATSSPTASLTKKMYLQVGAFASLMSAQKVSEKITGLANVPTRIAHNSLTETKPIYRVQIGPFLSEAESNRIKTLLQDYGIGKAITIHG